MRYYDYTVKPYLHTLFSRYGINKELQLADLDEAERNKLFFYAGKLREIGFIEADMSAVEENIEIYLVTGDKKDKEIMADSLLAAYMECHEDYITKMIAKEFELFKDSQEVERKLEAGMKATKDPQTGEITWE